MTSDIPKMPEVEKSEAVGNLVMQMYATALENHARDLAARLEASNALCAELAGLLTRYRNETPLGHQPHMIAHQADAALTRFQEATR